MFLIKECMKFKLYLPKKLSYIGTPWSIYGGSSGSVGAFFSFSDLKQPAGNTRGKVVQYDLFTQQRFYQYKVG